jgi:biopolymer transport protein TolQ
MHEPISILALILNASLVVQIVMATLVLASLISWVLIFQRGFLLSSVKRMAINFEDQFWSGQDLRSIFVELENLSRTSWGSNTYSSRLSRIYPIKTTIR